MGGSVADHVVWGIVDSLDVVRALHNANAGCCAEAISRQPAHAIEPDAPLSDAVHLMDEHDVTQLVVVDRGRPVGVLSTRDIAGAGAWGRR